MSTIEVILKVLVVVGAFVAMTGPLMLLIMIAGSILVYISKLVEKLADVLNKLWKKYDFLVFVVPAIAGGVIILVCLGLSSLLGI
jgi:hypothetical protein